MLVDTHCHLDLDEFAEDRDDVIRRAHEAGVEAMLAVATDLESSRSTIQLAAKHPGVFASVGIHPNEAVQAQPQDWDEIIRLAAESKVVALGETGLDRHWDVTPFPLQQDYFDRHLRLSAQTGLPVVIHLRDCEADILEMLRTACARGPVHGVMHSFTGSQAAADECVEMGLYVSFAGMVTFKKSHELRAIAVNVPADRILVETDSPYLSPHPLRGRRNEPAHVVHTLECVAEARGVTVAALAEQVVSNCRSLFGFPRD